MEFGWEFALMMLRDWRRMVAAGFVVGTLRLFGGKTSSVSGSSRRQSIVDLPAMSPRCPPLRQGGLGVRLGPKLS
jgi:hypothetical protein